jgi:hypothetical protein
MIRPRSGGLVSAIVVALFTHRFDLVLVGPEEGNQRKQDVFRPAVSGHVINEGVEVDVIE